MLGRLRRFLSTETERAVADLPNASELLPPPPYVTSEFNAILDRIKSGKQLRSSELLPYLSCPLKVHRQEVNFRLAEVYTAAGQLEQAKVFVQRSWILSNFADEVLPLYLKIHETLKDAKAIREAYKRIGLKKIDENVSPAIYYFGMSQYADSHHHCVDMFEYDFDMLDAIRKAAERFHPQVRATASEAEPTSKVRVGYLVKGITDVNSIIVRHIMTLTKYRDQSNFEV